MTTTRISVPLLSLALAACGAHGSPVEPSPAPSPCVLGGPVQLDGIGSFVMRLTYQVCPPPEYWPDGFLREVPR
jgi:hypothetical protein